MTRDGEYPEVRLLRVQAGDVLVVQVPEALDDDGHERLVAELTGMRDRLGVPGVQVVVLDSGASMSVLRPDDTAFTATD